MLKAVHLLTQSVWLALCPLLAITHSSQCGYFVNLQAISNLLRLEISDYGQKNEQHPNKYQNCDHQMIGEAHFENSKQLLEYKNYLLLRDTRQLKRQVSKKVHCSSFVKCLPPAMPLQRVFLWQPLTVLTKQTRQAVCAIISLFFNVLSLIKALT